MRRIGLLVEPEFLERHWGVRVYVYSLAKVLARHGWLVDFIVAGASSANEPRWYRLHLTDADLFSNAAPSSSGTPGEVWAAMRRDAFPPRDAVRPAAPPPQVPVGLRRPCLMPVGSNLASERYDALVITNPWMVKWTTRLPARRVFGLVFDLIPNLFGILSDESKPFAFAHQHEFGFRHFETCTDGILTISEATREAYLDLVRSRRPDGRGPQVIALPPMAPYYAFDGQALLPARERPTRIVLAGCFDLRKGLRELPGLLNPLGVDLDEVVVYGGVRCREGEVDAFFRGLQVPRVTWHMGPTASHVRDIFRTSRLLVFPSRHEGLGLPLLEAQLQGCRVATYPVSPMQDLALSGAVTLDDDPGESARRLTAALHESFDHAALAQEAAAAFIHAPLASDPLAGL